MRGMASLVDQLSQLLDGTGTALDLDDRIRNLNKMKMLLYLFCQMIQVQNLLLFN